MAKWSDCAICGRAIPLGELCYGIKNWKGDPEGGETICKDCLVLENSSTLIPPNEWISVSDKLPEEKEYVLIAMHDVIEVARIEKGISQEERRKMKSGEIPDAEEFGYEPGKPPFVVKRSDSIRAADQEGNNLVPYIWRARSGRWSGSANTLRTGCRCQKAQRRINKMQSVSPDYKARKQGKPTMPLKERLYSKIKINEYTGCWECARNGKLGMLKY